ncbi:MAG: hypothetical protein IKO49_02875 [Bacilli bacterium]|nr:hypothetical protein [Bacilli bacterium]
MKKYILGISAYYHDSAACIVVDGKIIAASSEERFTRKKGDSSFPHNAINFCLNTVGKKIEDIDYIVFYEDYLNKFSRILSIHHTSSPFGLKSFLYSLPKWLSTKLWLEKEIKKELGVKKKKILFFPHHISHAASAFYPSPYKSAAIMCVDGVGEWNTLTLGIGKNNKINLLKCMNFPDSVGMLYSAFTYYTGFKVNSGEYKLMGLAPYGKPQYVNLIKKELVTIYEDGSIKLNQKYFNYTTGLTMTNSKFNKLFGGKPRKPEDPITKKEMDLASSIQEVTNEILLKCANYIYTLTKEDNLVLAGGVALNVTSIGYLKRFSKFKNIWVQPASGDAGGALGCALFTWYDYLNNPRNESKNDNMNGAFLGYEIKDKDDNYDKWFVENGGNFKYLNEASLIEKITELLADRKVVGIARGKMEFGPRALGNRSIIADPRDEKMQSNLNQKIKFRESFRPFAPMVLIEDASKYFEIKDESPYMLSTYPIKKSIRKKTKGNLTGLALLNESRSTIPAVTHVDYSARVQTVDKNRNPFTYSLLTSFKKKTDCSVLINTSFNVRGEPIVCDEKDAFRCFMNTNMDAVIIGNRLFLKEKQDKNKYFKLNKKVKYDRD